MRFSQHFKAVGTLVHTIYVIDKIYEDDELNWDDAPTIATFIAGELLIWGGDILDWRKVGKKPLYIIEAAILIGGVTSYAIGGREGLVAYTDVLTGQVGPGEWYDVVAPEVKKELKEKKTQMLGVVSLVYNMGVRELERKALIARARVEAVSEFLEDLPGKFLTGPYLPPMLPSLPF